MQMTVNQSLIMHANERPGAQCGVAQIRQTDARGRVTKEGCSVIVLRDDKGTEVRVLLNPDEATVMGMSILGCAMRSADQLPPDFVLAPPPNGVTPSGLVVKQ